ncbi:MAG TPA: ATP synthase F1 subunit gamma [Candidatus Polarisedimenticolia bacterium]|nr:ATP synthase F1 subunit gamma [Candidatus Polarisedimenticolia bacterium]
MPNLRDIRTRIRSIKNTQQLTYTMKLVSATKLRRAQEQILAARPYARQMLRVLNSLATRAHPESHPLLQHRDEKKVEMVVITADRGLCGGFNANILKITLTEIRRRGGVDLSVIAVGKKGRDLLRRRRIVLRREMVDIFRKVSYAHAAELARELVGLYSSGERDAIYLVYNEFKSAIQQRVVLEKLLPIEKLPDEGRLLPVDYLYEPGQREIFDQLLPKHVEVQVYRALLESAAAEHGARMSAMDSATKNAAELIEDLTLNMNKVRQAGITKEILEVVAGAAALE